MRLYLKFTKDIDLVRLYLKFTKDSDPVMPYLKFTKDIDLVTLYLKFTKDTELAMPYLKFTNLHVQQNGTFANFLAVNTCIVYYIMYKHDFFLIILLKQV